MFWGQKNKFLGLIVRNVRKLFIKKFKNKVFVNSNLKKPLYFDAFLDDLFKKNYV